MEITEDNIKPLIDSTTDLDLLKELVRYAMQFNREDLIERILEKAIQLNAFLSKLEGEGRQEP